MIHELKIAPEYFEAVVAGTKTVELRKNDREPAFAVGDILRLREYGYRTRQKWEVGSYTGREVSVRVTHVLHDAHHRWLQPGVVALSIARIPDTATPASTMLAEHMQLLQQAQSGAVDWTQATEAFFRSLSNYVQAAHIEAPVLDQASQEFVKGIRAIQQQLPSASPSGMASGSQTAEIQIDGVVQTQYPDQWWDAFVTWLESRGELFNGRIGGLGE